MVPGRADSGDLPAGVPAGDLAAKTAEGQLKARELTSRCTAGSAGVERTTAAHPRRAAGSAAGFDGVNGDYYIRG